MDLDQLEGTSGLFKLNQMPCSFCGSPATLLATSVSDTTRVLTWACDEHTSALADTGQPIWAVSRTCQAVENHQRCGTRAKWLEIAYTNGMMQPESRCARHKFPA